MPAAMKLLLVGCGKMGGAMLEGWLERGTPAGNVTIVEPDPANADALAERLGVNAITAADALPADFHPDAVVLAVKPQMMDDVVPAYAHLKSGDTVFLSIAAGKPIAAFEAMLGSDAAIVRAMPNTPAAVGRGITVGCPNANVSPYQEEQCKSLLSAIGDVEWLTDESLMDAVTALSGSGPAYVFHMVEAMAHGGRMAGLDPEMAERLARATVAGAGELLHVSKLPAETLRENVTSPGGTTAAALDVLMGTNALKDLMRDAIAAAQARSKELAG